MAPFPVIPPIPPQIFDAIEKEKFMVFIGAGVSRTLGCLGWQDMGMYLICACLAEGIIDNGLRDSLIDMIKNNNCKESISRCYTILEEIERLDVYETIIKSTCEGDSHKIRDYNIYDEILRIPAVYVTTNFDNILANKFLTDRIRFKKEDFKLDISREILYQIHGSISEPSTIVITERNYRDKYTNEVFIEFLRYIFKEYLVLFVGYGLEEIEINLQRYISITKNNYDSYILKPYHDNNLHMYDSDLLYYDMKGVTILPYYIENNNYDLLFNVIKQWNYEVKDKTQIMLEDFRIIDRVMIQNE